MVEKLVSRPYCWFLRNGLNWALTFDCDTDSRIADYVLLVVTLSVPLPEGIRKSSSLAPSAGIIKLLSSPFWVLRTSLGRILSFLERILSILSLLMLDIFRVNGLLDRVIRRKKATTTTYKYVEHRFKFSNVTELTIVL